jgi:DUF2917 family protein
MTSAFFTLKERQALWLEASMRPTELRRGSTLSLEGGAGTKVRVIAGNVWLTQYRDNTDYVMRSGDSAMLNGKGTTLIYAFDDSSLGFVAPESAPVATRMELRLRGVVA